MGAIPGGYVVARATESLLANHLSFTGKFLAKYLPIPQRREAR